MKKTLVLALCGALLCNTYTSVRSADIAAPQSSFLDAVWNVMGSKEGSTIISLCFVGLLAYTGYYLGSKLTTNQQFQVLKAGTIPESFASVAGNEAAKDELADIIAYFEDPSAFHEIGAAVPKGILLTGPSGTGKTLLARALAGEVNCSFIAVSGSEFNEMYMGVGAARVRALFAAARALNGPCIIFIDEIDSLMGERNNDPSGPTQDIHRTLNEFLTQVDGFKKHKHPIIIVGATNRPHVIDEAALRPGRFDRIVQVDLPDTDDREKILALHTQKVKHTDNLDLKTIAEKTDGLAGAHLAAIINEAALIALKQRKKVVDQSALEAALHKMIQSRPKPKNPQELVFRLA